MTPTLTLAPPAPTTIASLQTKIFFPEELPRNFQGKFIEQYASAEDVPGPCWVWTAAKQQGGYGMVRDLLLNRAIPSHRVAYEHLVGPVPDDHQLDHLCRVTACCNPLHLEAVTRSENVRRSIKARRSGKARSTIKCTEGPVNPTSTRTHCNHGHPWTEENLTSIKRPDGTHSHFNCRLCIEERSRRAKERRREAKLVAQQAPTTADFAEAA